MRKNPGVAYAAPSALWFTVFLVAPLAIIVTFSFMTKGVRGGVVMKPTLDAYMAILNPVFAKVALNTLLIAAVSTFITMCIAIPCGYYMARSKRQQVLLLLVIIPFWTNFLIRIYAWITILGNNGALNSVLMGLGLVKEHRQFLYNEFAVILVLVYTYLPYAILPLFSTIDKFDFQLLEAARDLGATKFAAIRLVLFPNIRSGIFTAFLFTFIPIFGAYAVPLLVGGKESYMLGNIIADELTKTRNWPLASAISMVITVLTTIGVLALMRVNKAALFTESVRAPDPRGPK